MFQRYHRSRSNRLSRTITERGTQLLVAGLFPRSEHTPRLTKRCVTICSQIPERKLRQLISVVEKPSAAARQLIVSTFETPVDVDVMGVGVPVERWSKNPICSEAMLHWHRNVPLSSHYASAVTRAVISSHMSWKFAPPFISTVAHPRNRACGKDDLHRRNKQETNICLYEASYGSGGTEPSNHYIRNVIAGFYLILFVCILPLIHFARALGRTFFFLSFFSTPGYATTLSVSCWPSTRIRWCASARLSWSVFTEWPSLPCTTT